MEWAPPLDIVQVKDRIKRYLEDYCADRSGQCGGTEQVEQSLAPIRFRPVPSDLCRWCFQKDGTEKPSVRVVCSSCVGTYRNTDIQNLPIELYSEIARHAQPIDLLNLSRVSKLLRSILMSKGNRQVWRTSLLAIPLLPPCPKDMSEPRYTALLFDQFCWACGSRDGDSVDYFLRLRLCSWCFYENVVSGAKVEILRDLHYTVRDVVTLSLPCQMQRETFYPHDNTDVSPLSHILEDRFFKPELHAMVEKLSSPTISSDCLETFLLNQAKYIRQRHVDAVELYKWEALIIKFNETFNGLRLARGYTWSPHRDVDGSPRPLEPCPEPVSMAVTEQWRTTLLNAKNAHDIEREGSYRNSRVKNARQVRLNKRKVQLSDWAVKMLASHPRFRGHDPDSLPTPAHIGEMLKRHAKKDDARCSLDGILTLEHPEDSEEASKLLDSLDGHVYNYFFRSRATAALQVVQRTGDKRYWSAFGRQEVEQVMCLKHEQYFPILSRPDALFSCLECWPQTPCSWREVHAHYRKTHPDVCGLHEDDDPAGDIGSQIRQWEGASFARDIVAELGLGEQATIASLSVLVESGQLTCVCGAFEASDDTRLDWPTLVHHIFERVQAVHIARREQAFWRSVQHNPSEALAPQAEIELGCRACVKMITMTPEDDCSSQPTTCEHSASDSREDVVSTTTGEYAFSMTFDGIPSSEPRPRQRTQRLTCPSRGQGDDSERDDSRCRANCTI